MMAYRYRIAAMVLGVLFSSADMSAVWAGGDDHDAASAAAPVQVSPRGHARSDGIEAVAVAAPNRRLVLYLDRLQTNEPLVGAAVNVDADGFTLNLRDTGNGIYMATDWYPSPGPNRLIVSYKLDALEGKIEVPVEIPQAAGMTQARLATAAVRIEQANIGMVVAGALAVYLAAMSLFMWRARRLRVPAR